MPKDNTALEEAQSVIIPCPACRGLGTVPTECPRCFGKGQAGPPGTMTYREFNDGVTLVTIYQNNKIQSLNVLQPGMSLHSTGGIYVDRVIHRQLKCCSNWYFSRWGGRKERLS